MTTKRDLLRLVESQSEDHIRLLQLLVQAPSPNPPGDTRRAIAVVKTFLQSKGITSDIIAPREDSPNLVSVLPTGSGHDAVRPSAGRTLVLNGHIDQFPVGDGERWQRDPYSGDIVGGFLHGRSGVDMKAGTAASVIAFAYMHALQAELAGRCVLEVVSDEETGGRWGTRYLLEDHEQRGLWKGDCVLVGEPGGLQSIRMGEKGTLRMTVSVTARDGHGAYIHRSEGAIRIAARIINRLVALESASADDMDTDLRDYIDRPDVREVADGIMGAGAADAMLRTTVNVGTIRGGTKINMIPPECTFEVEFRIPISVRVETVLDRVDRVFADFPHASYDIHADHSHPSTYSPRDHELVEVIQQNVRELGGARPLPIPSLGGTDCKHFRRHGIPAYAFGPSPRGMAERDEKVSIDEFLHLVKVHTLTAWDYLRRGR